MTFQSFFMSTTVHPRAGASSSALSSRPTGDARSYDHSETRSCRHGRPLQHLKIAIGVPGGEDRAPADDPIDPNRLARPVIDELDLRQLEDRGLAVLQAELCLAIGADDLLWRNAIDPGSPGPDEFDAPARDDEGLEALLSQISQQLQHWLKDEVDIEPVEARMPR